jgi:hypothetical protein
MPQPTTKEIFKNSRKVHESGQLAAESGQFMGVKIRRVTGEK